MENHAKLKSLGERNRFSLRSQNSPLFGRGVVSFWYFNENHFVTNLSIFYLNIRMRNHNNLLYLQKRLKNKLDYFFLEQKITKPKPTIKRGIPIKLEVLEVKPTTLPVIFEDKKNNDPRIKKIPT